MMGTVVLGPRIGKYNEDGSVNVIPGHSMPLAMLGMFVLWFGWFGFNPGSTLSGIEAGLIAKVAVNTNMAAAVGAVVAMAIAWLQTGKPDVGLTMNGALAGLVAITAPCAFVSLTNSIIIGAVAGIIAVFGVTFLDRVRVDDPVGAIPVHAFCGVWGTLSLGFFHESQGLFNGGGWQQLGIQALGIVSVFAWVTITAGALFWILKYTIGLRVSDKEERIGLDYGEHAVRSYINLEVG